jgi:hypothetical protein
MTWEKLNFTGRDMILIICQVITATSFVLIMKGDIRTLVNGQQRMEGKQDKAEQAQEALRAKTEVEITELKVRIGILEQKVVDLQIQRDSKQY